jgi:hypothetical protein
MADERVTEIEVISAPGEYGESDYQFFKNNSTGQLWKAKANILPAHAPMINGDVEAAPTQLAVSVTVSPIDEEGKALREDDKPIILDVHMHTFTQVEMADPDFDPSKRVMQIVAERVHVGEARLDAVKKIKQLGDNWNKKAKLSVGKFTYREAAPKELGVTTEGAPVAIVEGNSVSAPQPASAEAPPASETGPEGVEVAPE